MLTSILSTCCCFCVQKPPLEETLQETLDGVNQFFVENGSKYEVVPSEGKPLEAKSPIFLDLIFKSTEEGVPDERVPIGITHFVHLVPDFESAPYARIARTVDELRASVLKAVRLNLEAGDEEMKKAPKAFIAPGGTPFYTNGHNIKVDNEGYLLIEKTKIIYPKAPRPFKAHMLHGEGGITFRKLENGDFATSSPGDKREGKGIFFNMDPNHPTRALGEIYRG